MAVEDINYWLALWRIPKLGVETFTRLVTSFQSLAEAFRASPTQLKAFGLSTEQISHMATFVQQKNPELSHGVGKDLAWLSEETNHLITIKDSYYPALLKEIPDPPPLLFVKGNPALLNWPQIAIVGSRHPSRQGLKNSKEFAKYFVQQGFAVTSGLALGIDSAAHQGALEGAGPTIGVTAHGLDKIFPSRSRALAREMLADGAWVSEFPIGVEPKPGYFPRRNRIISGLSLGVLVVEAAVKSGSLITAHQALQQNREVFAIPGSIHNPLAKGCHALIRQGAKLVEQALEVTDELMPLLSFQQQQLSSALSVQPVRETLTHKASYQTQSPEYKIMKVLDCDPMLVDEIVLRTGLSVADVNAALVMMELEGIVAHQQGGYAIINAT